MSEKIWYFLSDRIKQEKKDKIEFYAEKYLVPIVKKHFPELSGRIYLNMRKYGYYAGKNPVYRITIRESSLTENSDSHIRATTTHELVHLLQFDAGFTDKGNMKIHEFQAEFYAFSRGAAYDYLKTCQEECDKEKCDCDMSFYYGYYHCRSFFNSCCKNLSDATIREMAENLRRVSVETWKTFGWDFCDYRALIEKTLLGNPISKPIRIQKAEKERKAVE